MKRAVVVLSHGIYPLVENSRRSIQAAATRWDAQYVELSCTLLNGTWWDKFFINLAMKNFDVVVQLDHDVVVRADCPDLFDFLPDDDERVIAIARDAQPADEDDSHGNCVREGGIMWHATTLNLPAIADQDVFNSGVIVYRPGPTQPLWQKCRDLGQKNKWDGNLEDQVVLSLMMRESNWPHHLLGPEYNRTNLMRAGFQVGGVMHGYIYHYAGQGRCEKEFALERTRWWEHPTKTPRTVSLRPTEEAVARGVSPRPAGR
jgi:hypothetical protein